MESRIIQVARPSEVYGNQFFHPARISIHGNDPVRQGKRFPDIMRYKDDAMAQCQSEFDDENAYTCSPTVAPISKPRQ